MTLLARAQPEELDEVLELDRACLAECAHDGWKPADDGVIYVAHDLDGRVCAFGSAKPSSQDPYAVYLDRAGVAPFARGRGLHRQMVQARLRWARARGAMSAVTDTLPTNVESANNLIRCGFRLFRPAVLYAGEHWCYWRRDFLKHHA